MIYARRVSPRTPRDTRRIPPGAWASRARSLGVRDHGRPGRRPLARSPSDSRRDAKTATCRARSAAGGVVPETRHLRWRTAAATASWPRLTGTGASPSSRTGASRRPSRRPGRSRLPSGETLAAHARPAGQGRRLAPPAGPGAPGPRSCPCPAAGRGGGRDSAPPGTARLPSHARGRWRWSSPGGRRPAARHPRATWGAAAPPPRRASGERGARPPARGPTGRRGCPRGARAVWSRAATWGAVVGSRGRRGAVEGRPRNG